MAEPQQQPPADQFQYIQLPDGSYGKFSAGASDEEIRGHIQKDFPDAFKPPPTMAQNIQKSFDVNTQTNPNEPLLETGLKSVVHGAGFPLMHPKQFAMGVGKQLVNAASMNPMATAAEMAGPIASDVREGGGKYAATKGLGEAFGGMAAMAPLAELPGAVRGGMGMARSMGERVGGYKSPIIDPTLQQAGKMAKAIGGPIPHGLEADIAAQTPRVKAFAQETGNPMHSQQEVGHAFRSSGERGLEHFNQNILGPNAQDYVPMGEGEGYQGFTGPNKDVPMKTLGQINDRLTQINNLTRAADNAKNTGAAMTALERTGLDEEANFLRGRLYDELSKRTGIPPEEIKAHREGYGQQFGIADVIDQARRARMSQMGQAAEGGGNLPTSKAGLVDKALTSLRGGREYIANRNMRQALQPFETRPNLFPRPIYPSPKPNPYFPPAAPAPEPFVRTPVRAGSTEVPTFGKTPDVEGAARIQGNIASRNTARTAATEANRAAAAREFLHSTNLEQAAQEAANQRAAQAGTLRGGIGEGQRMAAQQEFLHANDLEQAAQDAAAGRATRTAGTRMSRDKLAESMQDLIGEAARTKGRENALEAMKKRNR